MIDREARDKLALAIRRLGSGRITLKEFRKSVVWDSEDTAISYIADEIDEAIQDQADWNLQFWSKVNIPSDLKKQMACVVVYLHSDNELPEELFAPAGCFSYLVSFSLLGVWLTAITVYVFPKLFPAAISQTVRILVNTYLVITYGITLVAIVLKWVTKLNHCEHQEEHQSPVLWPFEHQEDFDQAASIPRYLMGNAPATC